MTCTARIIEIFSKKGMKQKQLLFIIPSIISTTKTFSLKIMCMLFSVDFSVLSAQTDIQRLK